MHAGVLGATATPRDSNRQYLVTVVTHAAILEFFYILDIYMKIMTIAILAYFMVKGPLYKYIARFVKTLLDIVGMWNSVYNPTGM